MPNQILQNEYNVARRRLRRAVHTNRAQWAAQLRRAPADLGERQQQNLIEAFWDLELVARGDGFNRTTFGALEQFRNALIAAARGTSEGEVLLDLFGYSLLNSFHDNEEAVKFASAAKFFRHCYRVDRAGAQTIWVVSQPAAYTQFTTDEVYDKRQNYTQLRNTLSDTTEIYSAAERLALFDATLQVKDWCALALWDLAAARNNNAAARARVKRWFANDDVDASIVNLIIAELDSGLRKIHARIRENQITYTDDPSKRGADNTLAYVFPNEQMRSIYIKRNFFDTNEARFNTQDYWAITLLHELSHRVLKTEDHRYDWQQIGFRSNFHIGHAISNADSWAFYAADCANRLNPGQIAWVKSGHAYHHHHP